VKINRPGDDSHIIRDPYLLRAPFRWVVEVIRSRSGKRRLQENSSKIPSDCRTQHEEIRGRAPAQRDSSDSRKGERNFRARGAVIWGWRAEPLGLGLERTMFPPGQKRQRQMRSSETATGWRRRGRQAPDHGGDGRRRQEKRNRRSCRTRRRRR
jgi:hypothetical protein